MVVEHNKITYLEHPNRANFVRENTKDMGMSTSAELIQEHLKTCVHGHQATMITGVLRLIFGIVVAPCHQRSTLK